MTGYLVGAVPYWVGIKRWVDGANMPRQFMRPGEFPKNPENTKGTMKGFILSFLKSLGKFAKMAENQSGICVDPKSIDGSIHNEIRCIVRAGKYGLDAELRNINTGSLQKRSKDDCELMQFNMRIVFSDKHEKAIVILERYGIYSPATMVFGALRQFIELKLKHADARMESGLITNVEYMRQQYSNRVKAVHFVTHQLPPELCDHVRGDVDMENPYVVDMKISAGRNKYLHIPEIIKRLRKAKARGMTVGNVSYEDVKVELEVGGRRQTVIAGAEMFRIVYDITNSIARKDDGHPTVDSFVAATQQCLANSKETLDWED